MTARPKILICNERFLTRFGVDRILIILARHLIQNGYDVVFSCLRHDSGAMGSLASRVIDIDIPPGLDLVGAERTVAERLTTRWSLGDKPDLLVTGGWPFFESAARARHWGIKSVFIDAGAVPHSDLTDPHLSIQQELRRIRFINLPLIDRVLPISEFIRYSQSEFDHCSSKGIQTVLLGADHLDGSAAGGVSDPILDSLDRLIADGADLLLALGRFEAVGYKNSRAGFEVLRSVRKNVGSAKLLILAGSEAVQIPPDIRSHVITLPTVSDAVLVQVMLRAKIGLSLSRWEGFDLPLTEMQSLWKPVLAFMCGAHPEVAAEPSLLCATAEEMASKAVDILQKGLSPLIDQEQRFKGAKERLRWKNTLLGWQRNIDEVLASPAFEHLPDRRLVLVDTSNSARDPANSGVIRVTRRLTAHLQDDPSLIVVCVVWDSEKGTYRLPKLVHRSFLSSNAGPMDWLGSAVDELHATLEAPDILSIAKSHPSVPPTLFLPEVILDGTAEQRVDWARKSGMNVAFILYDLLPIYYSDFVDKSVSASFPSYLKAVGRADHIWSISRFSLEMYEHYLQERSLESEAVRESVWLPGQFSNCPRPETRERALARENLDAINIICVSTIEPRKNHRSLLKAFQLLRQRRPDLPLQLRLIGNRYAGANDLIELLEDAMGADSSIQWLGVLPDEAIEREYLEATISVYPSLAEGYGLPIMESLWMGCPCICHNSGVMAELAHDGGCIVVDMNDAEGLSLSMERALTEPNLLAALEKQAEGRCIPTWDDYAKEIGGRLKSNDGVEQWGEFGVGSSEARSKLAKLAAYQAERFGRIDAQGAALLARGTETSIPADSDCFELGINARKSDLSLYQAFISCLGSGDKIEAMSTLRLHYHRLNSRYPFLRSILEKLRVLFFRYIR